MVGHSATSNEGFKRSHEDGSSTNIDKDDAMQSDSYTQLLQYCEDSTWQEEAPKRTSTEYVWTSQKARDANLHNAACSDDEKSYEKDDLEDAYKVMSKMAAEYISLEKSMSDNKEENCHLPSGPLPVMKVSEEKQRRISLLQQPFSPHIYREGIALCRDWLMEHYEAKEGVSILRSAMYSHYLDFCQDTSLDPINMASFGKAVRATFEGLRTRRLGMRGHSKYHYYGLTVKDSSPYRDILLSTQRINNEIPTWTRKKFSSLEDSTSTSNSSDVWETPPAKHPRTFVPACKKEYDLQGLLQRFPSHLSVCVSRDLKLQLAGMLSVYRSHCELLYRRVIENKMSSIGECMRHFWQNLRPDLKVLVSKPKIIDVIKLCDIQLCKTIANLLMPSFSEPVPVDRVTAARQLCHDYLAWTSICMQGFDLRLVEAKVHVAKMFVETIERQAALANLCHVVRSAMRSSEESKELFGDWRSLDYDLVTTDICAEIQDESQSIYYYIRKCLTDFERLLSQQAYLKKFLLFAGNVLRYSTSQLMKGNSSSTTHVSPGDNPRYSAFLLHWCRAVEIITRELTLKNVPSLAKLHVLGLMLTDYMLLLIGEEKRAHCEATLKARVYTGKSVDQPMDHMGTSHTRFTTINASNPGRPSSTGLMSRDTFTKLTQQAEVGPSKRTEHGSQYVNMALPEVAKSVLSEPTMVNINVKTEPMDSAHQDWMNGNNAKSTHQGNDLNQSDSTLNTVFVINQHIKSEEPSLAKDFRSNGDHRLEWNHMNESNSVSKNQDTSMSHLSCSEMQFRLENMKREAEDSTQFVNGQEECDGSMLFSDTVLQPQFDATESAYLWS